MSIFKKIFGKTRIEQGKQKGEKKKPVHAVIVYFDYKKDNLEPLHKLEDELERVIAKHHLGKYDGNEMAINLNDGILFVYEPNAELLYKAIKPTLLTRDFVKGSAATKMGLKPVAPVGNTSAQPPKPIAIMVAAEMVVMSM
jgi:hypothetical protein